MGENVRIEPGQFWRDTVNTDLLKILEVKEETLETGDPFVSPRETKTAIFVRAACIVGGKYLGLQEMQASHFETDRFRLIRGSRLLWYRWKANRELKRAGLTDSKKPAR